MARRSNLVSLEPRPIKDGLRQVIQRAFAELSPALQNVARYVLDHPNDVVIASMRAVAIRSGSNPPTLVRFAQKIGLRGWVDLKRALVQEMGLGPEPYGTKARTLVRRAKDLSLGSEMFKVHEANLHSTQRLNAGSLRPTCEILERAKVVHVAGFRACFPVAYSFVYVYRLFRQTVQLMEAIGGSLEMQLRALDKDDALLVVSFAPYSREAIQAAKVARQRGAAIVALSDSAASPIALLADETVLFSTNSPSFFPSIAAAIAIAEGLLELLASRAGKSGIRRIEASEEYLFASGAYVGSRARRGRRSAFQT